MTIVCSVCLISLKLNLTFTMASLVEQLKNIAASLPDSVEHDDAVRLPAITAAKQIISTCERPFEIAGRVAWGVSHSLPSRNSTISLTRSF